VRRAPRYPFAATVELTDLQSEIHIQQRTIELSLYGCGVAASTPFPGGTRVRIRITHEGDNFVALGKVIYALADGEMGIAFTRVEHNDQIMLEKWISEQRGHK
jgi:hypothetical protein